ncbi:hypothetical protein LCGC14_1645740 [marine sediment metagenome]|uniref:Uncharacterized protein n=1 Tax=marine sediment metagenome TaxID=412755 RepID=A0A0F9HY99_9ZZZZ
MSKKKTYSASHICPNCIELAQLEIPMGTSQKDYVIDPDLLCKSCGCRLDGNPIKPKPPEPKQTMGQEWAGVFGAFATCPVGENMDYCHDVPCGACRCRLAKAFDIGLAAREPAMTLGKWLAQRPLCSSRPNPCCEHPPCRQCHTFALDCIRNYIELNKGKVIQ